MDTGAIITLLVAVISSGVLTTALAQWWGRKRNRADTAAVLNETALDLIVPLREQIKEMRGELDFSRQRIGSLERREREILEALSQHAAWDMVVRATVTAANVEVPEMPPLYPSSLTRREEFTRADDIPRTDIEPRRRKPREATS